MPKTHDYTKRSFGHDCTFRPRNGGLEASMTGWGNGIGEGDFLLLSNPASSRGSSRYQVKTITYYRDPPDMWKADVVFAPRYEAEKDGQS